MVSLTVPKSRCNKNDVTAETEGRGVPYLDGDQHLVAVGTQVGTFCQVDFAERSFAQLPLQHNVLSFDMLDT